MLNKIPINRLLLYLILLGFIPVVVVLAIFYTEKSEQSDLQNFIETIQQQAVISEKKQALNMTVRHHFRDADHFYIDKHLEKLVFLEPEIEALQHIVTDKNFTEDERVKKRLEYLTTSANSLVFSEGVVQSFPLFQETMESLVHPVELNATDIMKTAALIEGVQIGPYTPAPNRPQMIITELKLEKKAMQDHNEIFQLNLKLLKREFL